MTTDDHAALVALGRKMAATNGYKAMQSSSLYVTDGDEIDWAYGNEHIFMYTFELYPEPQPGQLDRPVLPARRGDRAADRAEQGRHPDAHRSRRLPVQRERHGEGQLRAALRQTSRPTAAGSPTRSGPTRQRPARWQRANPSDHGPPGGDRAVRLARPRHRPPGRRDGQLVRRRRRRDDGPLGAGRAPGARSARSPSATTSRTARTRRRRTTSVRTSRMPRASARWSARKSAPRTPTCRPGRRRRSR